jgi:hypothetical protein
MFIFLFMTDLFITKTKDRPCISPPYISPSPLLFKCGILDFLGEYQILNTAGKFKFEALVFVFRFATVVVVGFMLY